MCSWLAAGVVDAGMAAERRATRMAGRGLGLGQAKPSGARACALP